MPEKLHMYTKVGVRTRVDRDVLSRERKFVQCVINVTQDIHVHTSFADEGAAFQSNPLVFSNCMYNGTCMTYVYTMTMTPMY